MTLLRRVFLTNAAVLAAATAALAFTPLTISFPVALSEALVLTAGLLVMLALNWLALRRALAPVDRLVASMQTIDPLQPGSRVAPETGEPHLDRLAIGFNAMAERLEAERASTTRRTLTAQEEERRRLSREIHDEIGQALTAAMLQLDMASRGGDEAVAEAREAVRHALDALRALARNLRPEALDDLGLPAALNTLSSQFSRRTGIDVERRLPSTLPPLGHDAELALYRVAQEAITNAARHAGATRIVLSLVERDGRMRLEVRDDGTGAGPGGPEGAGIRGMRERALLAGGALEIAAVAGGGTVVRLEVPVG